MVCDLLDRISINVVSVDGVHHSLPNVRHDVEEVKGTDKLLILNRLIIYNFLCLNAKILFYTIKYCFIFILVFSNATAIVRCKRWFSATQLSRVVQWSTLFGRIISMLLHITEISIPEKEVRIWTPFVMVMCST